MNRLVDPSFGEFRLGAIDEGEVAKPGMHVWTKCKASWGTISDDLPQFEMHP